jgi:hypothetical protein
MSDNSKEEKEEQERKIAQRELLISAWKARDELYKELFGDYSYVTPSNYGPPPEDIRLSDAEAYRASNDTGDPGLPPLDEQHLAVLAYAPDPLRPYWTYVTAGLCSPWVQDAPDEVSGFGCELMIKSSVDAKWPAQILRSMAYYIFNHAGTLSPGVRIALNAPIDPATDSRLRNVFIWYADEAPDCWYALPSGGFGLFITVGITDDELRFAESVNEYGTWCVQALLTRVGYGQITDPQRVSAMTHAESKQIIESVRAFAENFRMTEMAKQQSVIQPKMDESD